MRALNNITWAYHRRHNTARLHQTRRELQLGTCRGGGQFAPNGTGTELEHRQVEIMSVQNRKITHNEWK